MHHKVQLETLYLDVTFTRHSRCWCILWLLSNECKHLGLSVIN